MAASPVRPELEHIRSTAAEAAERMREGDAAMVTALGELQREKEVAAGAYRAVVRSLAAALEARDGYTGGHSDEVHDLAVAVALRLGLDDRAIEEVRVVALLHDIGKIGVPDHVLHKRGPLDAEEWALMQQHPVIGERILRPLPGMAAVADAVRHEHERWDGGGYPDGLRGEAIPRASRIVLACDAYHAMAADRPYRRALGEAEARAELRRCSGRQFDPAVVECLLAHLEDPAGTEAPPPAATEARQEGARTEEELQALLKVAAAVAGAHSYEDVLETAAEEARTALSAASVTIGRYDAERDEVRTLINVGDLAPWEVRRPAAEVYRLADFPELKRLLLTGIPHRAAVDDPDAEPNAAKLLAELGKGCAVAVPILYAGDAWGELYVTRHVGEPRFSDREIGFLQAITGQLAAAIGRGEVFGRLAELAFEDPLTGLANRRALDERLEAALAAAAAEDTDLALIVCDLDNLKTINDRDGHDAGDAALARAAGALTAAAARSPGSLVARLGGDEFCVLLPGRDAQGAREVASRALADLTRGEGAEASLSCGIASRDGRTARAADLLRSADTALYAAKRAGRRRVYDAVDAALLSPPTAAASTGRRAVRDRPPAEHRVVVDLLADVLARLDGGAAGRDPAERLEAVLLAAASALDAPAWAISWAPDGDELLHTLATTDLRHAAPVPLRPVYDLEVFAAKREVCARPTSRCIHVDADDAPAPERAELHRTSYRAVLAAGVPAMGGTWLLELFADGQTLPMEAAGPALRLLGSEAVRGAADRVGA